MNNESIELAKKNAAIDEALLVIHDYAGMDGSHHKEWVIDQVVRALTGEKYSTWIAKWESGEDGPNTYEWSEGIAP